MEPGAPEPQDTVASGQLSVMGEMLHTCDAQYRGLTPRGLHGT